VQEVTLRRKLNTFDVTSLVVGSIIGADIYVAAAFGARLVGPSSLLIWLVAGLMAIVIALCFSRCVRMMPIVGGPYAYSKESFGPFGGFIVGWSLLLAEWLSLAVFPVAFAQYSLALLPDLGKGYDILLKGAFILIVLGTNLLGIRAAGKVNDVLTVAKLAPLFVVIVAGVAFISFDPARASANFAPFFKGGPGDFATALVLIFWAYAGFELSTLPANEIERPERTIPRAIVTGMLIVAVFYITTNFVILGTVDQTTLASSQSPLMDATEMMFSDLGGLATLMPIIIGVGALLSILGADESGTIGTSRLAYAMSLDGLLPRSMSTLHSKYNTPYIGLAVICITAFVASIIGGLAALISASVFLLAFAYLATCASAISLQRKAEDSAFKSGTRLVLPILGIGFSATLLFLVGPKNIVVSAAMLLVGVPIYVAFTPRRELSDLKASFLSREAVLRRAYEQGEQFLAYPWRRLAWIYYRFRGRAKPWVVSRKTKAPPNA